MRIKLTSIYVDDQNKAFRFYTELLGFVQKRSIPVGKFDFLTVVSPEELDGTELLLEPDEHPAAQVFKRALFEQGIPVAIFFVDDVRSEYERLKALGVRFLGEPATMGDRTSAIFDDTCGNYVQITNM